MEFKKVIDYIEANKKEYLEKELSRKKSIYCKDCKVEEIVPKDKPNKCPFCESENVEVNRW